MPSSRRPRPDRPNDRTAGRPSGARRSTGPGRPAGPGGSRGPGGPVGPRRPRSMAPRRRMTRRVVDRRSGCVARMTRRWAARAGARVRHVTASDRRAHDPAVHDPAAPDRAAAARPTGGGRCPTVQAARTDRSTPTSARQDRGRSALARTARVPAVRDPAALVPAGHVRGSRTRRTGRAWSWRPGSRRPRRTWPTGPTTGGPAPRCRSLRSVERPAPRVPPRWPTRGRLGLRARDRSTALGRPPRPWPAGPP